MPIPKPGDDETQQKFISRCMGDDVMNKDYPSREQRSGVCYSQWRKVKGKSMEPEKDTRYELYVTDARLKAKAFGSPDAGWIEGYAAVFGNVDGQNQLIWPGAFAKTILDRVPSGKVKLMTRHLAHGGGAQDVVGTATEGKEDDYGLWAHYELSAAPSAQDLRQKVTEGHINGMSVGYKPIQSHIEAIDGKSVLVHTEMAWYDSIMTILPANELAVVTAAKALVDSDALSTESRVLSDNERGDVQRALSELATLGKSLEALLKSGSPQTPEIDLAALHDAIKAKRDKLALWFMELEG